VSRVYNGRKGGRLLVFGASSGLSSFHGRWVVSRGFDKGRGGREEEKKVSI
jgi:hypothetical protein